MKIIEKIAKRNADNHAHPIPKIVAFGDSNTQGCFEVFEGEGGKIDVVCDSKNAYHAHLSLLLGELFPHAAVTIVNAGISGDNTEGALKRLERDVLSEKPDLVISLHACDIATDLVIEQAISLSAEVVLSTPCCHRTLSRHINCAPLSFVTREPQLSQKLSEALTDGLRALRLSAAGYRVTVSELTDPENTPKNTIIRAVRDRAVGANRRREAAEREYRAALLYLFGDKADTYLNATR